MKIFGTGNISFKIENDTLFELKDIIQSTLLNAPRRTDRFIDLALIASTRCINGLELPTDTSLIIATGQGNLHETITVMNQIMIHELSPMPFNFINTLSNTAGFYIAQRNKIIGRNLLVSRKELSFEAALQLYQSDYLLNNNVTALVGSVDEAIVPVEYHKNRLGLSQDVVLGEGSGWLLLGGEKSFPGHTPRGEIVSLAEYNSIEALLEQLEKLCKATQSSSFLSRNFKMDDISWNQITSAIKKYSNSSYYDYINNYGYFDTVASVGISEFISTHRNSSLLHISKGSGNNYIVLNLSTF